MSKFRIKTFSHCFEGRQYTIQKRILFIFWMDCSNWFDTYDRASRELQLLTQLKKDGIKI